MALLPPFSLPGRFWRGNLHTHSLWSDGDDYPEMIADSYKRAGYHFLAMSDHNVLAEGARWLELKAPAAVKGEVVQKGGGAVLEKKRWWSADIDGRPHPWTSPTMPRSWGRR